MTRAINLLSSHPCFFCSSSQPCMLKANTSLSTFVCYSDNQLFVVIYLSVCLFSSFVLCICGSVFGFEKNTKIFCSEMVSPVNDPLVLLTNKGDRQPTVLYALYNPLACSAAGFGLALVLNWGFRRPLFSGKFQVT